MITYKFRTVVTIADLVESDLRIIKGLFSNQIRKNIDLSKYTLLTTDVVNGNSDSESEDVDLLIVSGEISSPEMKYSETSELTLKRSIKTAIQKTLEMDLESVANKLSDIVIYK